MEELFPKKRPEYPWQIEIVPWAPAAKWTEAERRADFARTWFECWKEMMDDGRGHRVLFFDERRGFFRFFDGTFALSRDHANWPALKEAGFFSGWGM